MIRSSLLNVTLIATLGLTVAACEGPAGTNGMDGMDGADGVDGTDGTDGVDGTSGTDGSDGEPGFASSRWWVAQNQSGAGTLSLRSATYSELGTADSETNEGVAFDAAGNLVQAGDGGVVGIRTFCGGIMDGDVYTEGRDRTLSGSNTTLGNPKGLVSTKGYVIVADVADGTLKVFGAAAGGDAAPIATNTLGATAWDLVYDEAGDRAFLALTNGTVGVIDGFAANGWTGAIDRTITPADDTDASIATNLHGIDYDADSDTLVVTDVGAANAAASADFASDGSLYVFSSASTLDGAVEPDRVVTGADTRLGNPVDLVLDGNDARIAEKAGGELLVFRDVIGGPSGNVAPDLWEAITSPESLAAVPDQRDLSNPTAMIDPFTPLLGVFVSSNPAVDQPEAGTIQRLSRNLTTSSLAFDTDRPSLENITFGADGTGYGTFDDGSTSGGVVVLGRMSARSSGSFSSSQDRTITGPNTTLLAPKGLEVVDSLGLLLVADIGTDGATAGVKIFGSCADGDVAPLATVDTAMARPWDLDHDVASDTLYLAFTDGTVGVYDDFTQDLGAGGPDRVLTPVAGGTTVSVNLHSVRYDAASDTLLLADVGLAADATDGQLFTLPFASTADGDVEVDKQVGGLLSGLGNPVDIAYDGRDLYVAEKANGAVLLYRDFLYTGVNPPADETLSVVAPESVVLAPTSLL